jgi:hypothetical protein
VGWAIAVLIIAVLIYRYMPEANMQSRFSVLRYSRPIIEEATRPPLLIKAQLETNLPNPNSNPNKNPQCMADTAVAGHMNILYVLCGWM